MTRELTSWPKDLAPRGRILELDALRGLAAVAVVLFHYTTRFQQMFGHQEPLAASVPWGHYGVALFFMLSGFVILMTLERTSHAVKFAWARFSRLYPAYWAAAALTFVVVSICGLPGEEVRFRDALVNVTMVQSLIDFPHIDGVYWSLQAELIFYGNMLLLYQLGAFRRPAATVVCWLFVAGAICLTQNYAETAWPLAASLLRKLATITSLKFIPNFGIGMLLYDAQRAGKSSKLTWIGLAGCLLSAWCWGGMSSLTADVLLATLLWFAISGRLPILAARPLVWLGAISYTLYLTHQNIGYVIIRHLESHGIGPLPAIAIAGVVALCLADTLHRRVERPAMQLMRKVDLTSLVGRAEPVAVNP